MKGCVQQSQLGAERCRHFAHLFDILSGDGRSLHEQNVCVKVRVRSGPKCRGLILTMLLSPSTRFQIRHLSILFLVQLIPYNHNGEVR